MPASREHQPQRRQLCTLHINETDLDVVEVRTAEGQLDIELYEQTEFLARLTRHPNGIVIEPEQVLVAMYSNYTELRLALLGSGFFEDTGNREGTSDLEVWKLLTPEA